MSKFFSKLSSKKKDKDRSKPYSPSIAPSTPSRSGAPTITPSSSYHGGLAITSPTITGSTSAAPIQPSGTASPSKFSTLGRRQSRIPFEEFFSPSSLSKDKPQTPKKKKGSLVPQEPTSPSVPAPKLELDFLLTGEATPAERPLSVYTSPDGRPIDYSTAAGGLTGSPASGSPHGAAHASSWPRRPSGIGSGRELTPRERERLAGLEVDAGKAAVAWKVSGADLLKLASDKPGTFRTNPSNVPTSISTLLAILLTSLSPQSLYPLFPTIQTHFPPPSFASDDHDWVADYASASGWVEDPRVLEGLLRLALRRMNLAPSNSIRSLDASGSILPKWYLAFASAESSEGFSATAWSQSLVPLLPPLTATFLDKVLDVLETLVVNGRWNGLTEAYLCGVVGWWVLGCNAAWRKRAGGGEGSDDWEEFERGWRKAGEGLSHLLRARIRERVRAGHLPLLLVELVAQYPSHTRITMTHKPLQIHHITLNRQATSPATVRYTAETLLSLVLLQAMRSEEELPKWLPDEIAAVRAASAQAQRKGSVDPIRVPLPDTPSMSTPGSFNLGTPLDLEVSKPLASAGVDSPWSLAGFPERTRGMSESSMAAPPAGAAANSLAELTAASAAPDWNEFAKSGFGGGFGDSNGLAQPFNLANGSSAGEKVSGPRAVGHNQKQDSVSSLPSFSPRARTRRSQAPRSNDFTKEALEAANADWSISDLQIVELEEAFVDFIEEASGDAQATKDWPTFALIKRTHGILTGTDYDERVLITVKDVPPAPPPATIPEGAAPDASLPRSPSNNSHGPLVSQALAEGGPMDAASITSGTTRRSDVNQKGLAWTLKRGRRKSLSLFKAFGSFGGQGGLENAAETSSPTDDESRSQATLTPTDRRSTVMANEFGQLSFPGDKALPAVILDTPPANDYAPTPPDKDDPFSFSSAPMAANEGVSPMKAGRANSHSSGHSASHSISRKPVPAFLPATQISQDDFASPNLSLDSNSTAASPNISQDSELRPFVNGLPLPPAASSTALSSASAYEGQEILLSDEAKSLPPNNTEENVHATPVPDTPRTLKTSSVAATERPSEDQDRDRDRRSEAPSPASAAFPAGVSARSGPSVSETVPGNDSTDKSVPADSAPAPGRVAAEEGKGHETVLDKIHPPALPPKDESSSLVTEGAGATSAQVERNLPSSESTDQAPSSILAGLLREVSVDSPAAPVGESNVPPLPPKEETSAEAAPSPVFGSRDDEDTSLKAPAPPTKDEVAETTLEHDGGPSKLSQQSAPIEENVAAGTPDEVERDDTQPEVKPVEDIPPSKPFVPGGNVHVTTAPSKDSAANAGSQLATGSEGHAQVIDAKPIPIDESAAIVEASEIDASTQAEAEHVTATGPVNVGVATNRPRMPLTPPQQCIKLDSPAPSPTASPSRNLTKPLSLRQKSSNQSLGPVPSSPAPPRPERRRPYTPSVSSFNAAQDAPLCRIGSSVEHGGAYSADTHDSPAVQPEGVEGGLDPDVRETLGSAGMRAAQAVSLGPEL